MPARRDGLQIPPPASTLNMDGQPERLDRYPLPVVRPGPALLPRLVLATCVCAAAVALGVLAALLVAGDAYQRAMTWQAVGGALFFVVGFVGLPIFVVTLRRQRAGLLVWIIALCLTGSFVWLGGTLATRAAEDLVVGPAVTDGPVTDHHVDVRSSGSHGGTRYLYVIAVNGQSWSIGRSAYGRAGVGTCVILTYGPHTRIVTDVQLCNPAP